MMVSGHYDLLLVALSLGMAMFASFTALDLTGRLAAAERASRLWWLFAAALALGGGVWSMHFIGMLAFVMPMPMTYDRSLTVISCILPVLAAGLGLNVASTLRGRWLPALVGGSIVGLGVVSMHYTGMDAMRMPGIVMSYDHATVAASVAIAIVAATAALWVALHKTQIWQKFVASVLMGAAIAGMHYTGMAAARFQMAHGPEAEAYYPALEPKSLAMAVGGATLALLVLALVAAFVDRKLALIAAREAETLRRSEERYRALIENSSDIIAIVDRDGVFVYEGSSARNVLGYATADLLGKRLADFAPEDHADGVQRFLETVLAAADATASAELPLLHASQTWRDFEIVGKNLLHEPAIGGIVVNLRDITERKRMMEQLEAISETDLLTGVLNRRGFMKLASREFERARRAENALTVVMLDLDHFKAVNDTFGHAAGDLVLAMVAEQCSVEVREADLVARIGGEEFAVVLADSAAGAAEIVIERLRRAIAAQRVSTIKGEVSVTASFGMAVVDPRLVDIDAALRLADEALYEAKHAGRNCIKIRAA